MARIIPGKPKALAAGEYSYNAVLSTGTVLMEISSDGGSTFRTMTDGTISVTSDGVMKWGKNNLFRATMSGDGVLDLQPVALS